MQFSHGIRQLRGSAGCAGLRGLVDPGNRDLRGTQLALGLQQGGAGDIHPGLIIARVDAHQDLAGFHRQVLDYQHFQHVTANLRRNRRDVPIYLGIVRRYAILEVQVRPDTNGHQEQDQSEQGEFRA